MAKEVAERDKLAKQEEEQSKQLINQLKMEYEKDRRQALEVGNKHFQWSIHTAKSI